MAATKKALANQIAERFTAAQLRALLDVEIEGNAPAKPAKKAAKKPAAKKAEKKAPPAFIVERGINRSVNREASAFARQAFGVTPSLPQLAQIRALVEQGLDVPEAVVLTLDA